MPGNFFETVQDGKYIKHGITMLSGQCEHTKGMINSPQQLQIGISILNRSTGFESACQSITIRQLKLAVNDITEKDVPT